jgi:circadian clock protein KaiB
MTDATERYEQAMEAAGDQHYVLRLYVVGMTPKSMRAIANLKDICEKHLKGRYELEVIDIYQNPVLAQGHQIIAAPTLVKELPLPLRKFIGDMSQTERILLGLDLKKK